MPSVWSISRALAAAAVAVAVRGLMCRPKRGDRDAGREGAVSLLSSKGMAGGGRPQMVVLLYDISKKKNVGTLVRSAVAFGVTKFIVVGRKRDLRTFGSQGTRDYMQFVYFDKFKDAVACLRRSGFRICGCEIAECARSVASRPFSGHTAFLFGNEGSGLNSKALAACDDFVYIPQYGRGTASLNVSVAASIALHQFAVWARYNEAPRDGFKFVLDPERKAANQSNHINFYPTEKDLRRQERLRRHEDAKMSAQASGAAAT